MYVYQCYLYSPQHNTRFCFLKIQHGCLGQLCFLSGLIFRKISDLKFNKTPRVMELFLGKSVHFMALFKGHVFVKETKDDNHCKAKHEDIISLSETRNLIESKSH